MPRYIKKPLIVAAIQWTGENIDELILGLKVNDELQRSPYLSLSGDLVIPSWESLSIASVGDYIVRDFDNELYICKPIFFKSAYDLVE